MSLRLRGFLVLVALSVFVIFIVASAAMYPGGNHHDRTYRRHHFWYNFLCDLLRRNSLDGVANLWGARCATLAMLAMAVAMGMYWTLAPALVPSHSLWGLIGRFAGLASTLGIVAVALTPSDRRPSLHTFAVVLATGPGLVAGLAVVTGRLSEPGTPVGLVVLGALTVVAVAATSAVYVIHTWFGGGFLRALPALQRVAAISTIIWVSVTAGQVTAIPLANSRPAAGPSIM